MKKLLLPLFLAFSGYTTAQTFTPDAGFGNNGAAIRYEEQRSSEAFALALQSDGKLLAAGLEYARDGQLYYESFITRFLPDGSLDPGFGNGGNVRIITGNKNAASAVAVQPDGKILVAANETIMEQNGGGVTIKSRPFVARFKADGSLDSTFAANGFQFLGVLNGYLDKELAAIGLLSDGRIIAGGSVATGADVMMILVALHPDGTYDTGFGSSGLAAFTAESGRPSLLFSLAIQPDNKIVFAGYSGDAGPGVYPDSRMAVLRVDDAGTPDAAFGTQGIVITQVSGSANPLDMARCLALQPDGKIVVAGQSGNGLALVRYLADGTLDNSFGQDGKLLSAGSPVPEGLALSGDKLYTCSSVPGSGDSLNMVISGFLEDGTADPETGTDGIYSGTAYQRNYLHAMLAQPDGKLVAAGAYRAANGEQGTLLVRYTTGTVTGITPAVRPEMAIRVFPNPAKDHITILLDNKTADQQTLCIYDMTGRQIHRATFKGQRAEIATGSWAPGIYRVRLTAGTQSVSVPVVKQ